MNVEVQNAISALERSTLILLIDDAARQPTGHFVAAAASITAEDIALMVNEGRGVTCAAISEDVRTEMGLPMMTRNAKPGTPDFTVSVEARQGVTTGISAADRARTLRTLAQTTQPKLDLVTPGHIFPWRAKRGGVLVRNTPADAAVDLLMLGGLRPVAAMGQCLTAEGTLPAVEELDALARKLGIPLVRISDIIRYRMATEPLVEKIAEAKLPTRDAGEFRAVCFRSKTDDAEHLALVKGDLEETDLNGAQKPVTVRVHAEQRISDLLGTGEDSSRARLSAAMQRIAEAGRGVFVYIRHPRSELLRENRAAEAGDPSQAASQLRELGIGSQILNNLGVRRLRLLTNSAREIRGVEAFQLEIVEREGF